MPQCSKGWGFVWNYEGNATPRLKINVLILKTLLLGYKKHCGDVSVEPQIVVMVDANVCVMSTCMHVLH